MADRPDVEYRVLAEDEISKLVQERVTLKTMGEIKEALASSRNYDFWKHIREMADECDDLLVSGGYPKAWEPILCNSLGDWREFSGDFHEAKNDWKLVRGADFVLDATKDFSKHWYAAQFGKKAGLALRHSKKNEGDLSGLFILVWELAQIAADWRWRAKHKKQIVTGKKQRAKLHDLREAKNQAAKMQAEERRMIVAELLAETSLTGGSLDNWLSKQMKLRHGISFKPRTYREDRKILKRQCK